MGLVSPEFEHFIARHFGPEGRAWLDRLPERVERYRREWQLEIERFLPGGLMACCLAVRLSGGGPAVLKLSGRWTRAGPEAVALRHWDGGPAPSLIRADPDGDALLLEQIVPGDSFGGGASEEDIASIARLIASLHAPAISVGDADQLPELPHVVERQIATAGAEARARSSSEAAELRPRLEQAQRRVASLLGTWVGRDVLLHGDLESKNILRCRRRGIVAIDPLACVGDPAYDAGYWLASVIHPRRREDTGRVLSRYLDLDADRVISWASVVALDC
jgi:streptomycin 6-kinase